MGTTHRSTLGLPSSVLRAISSELQTLPSPGQHPTSLGASRSLDSRRDTPRGRSHLSWPVQAASQHRLPLLCCNQLTHAGPTWPRNAPPVPWSPSTSSGCCCPLMRPRSQPTAPTAASLLGLPCSPGTGGSSLVRAGSVVPSLTSCMGPRVESRATRSPSHWASQASRPGCGATQLFVLLHSASLFLEVWSGEGSLQVRLEGAAKIKRTQEPQGRRGLSVSERPVCLVFT